jgi:hypothetical protein
MSFCIINLVLAVVASIWIIRIYLNKKYLFVKPSIVLLLYTHIFFQWPMALMPGYCERMLANPYVISFLINGYVIIGLFISPFIFQDKAKLVWSRVTSIEVTKESEPPYISIFILFFLMLLTTLVYLSYIPYSDTGLYTIFSDPANSAVAREKSLKLIDSQAIKYLYSLTRSCVVPLLFSCAFLRILMRWDSSRFNSLETYLEIVILFLATTFSSVTGERTFLAYWVLLGGLVILWKNGLKLNPIKIICFVLLPILPTLIITLLREGAGNIGFNNFLSFGVILKYIGLIIDRMFVVPFKVGLWYVKYAQDVGSFGIGAFPKLANLFGATPLNAPNIIGLEYAPAHYAEGGSGVAKWFESIGLGSLTPAFTLPSTPSELDMPGTGILKSVSAGAGYILSYYGYLGIISFPISLLGLLALDLSVLVYEKLKGNFLIPCLVSISLMCLGFINADYTVVLLTHGFVGIIILAWILSVTSDYIMNRINNFRLSHVAMIL